MHFRPFLTRVAWLNGRCQRQNILGPHSLLTRVRGRLDRGFGIRTRIRERVKPPPSGPLLGMPSRHEEGTWVRVRSAEEVRATLDHRQRLRGLEFSKQLWSTCGQVFQVKKVVRRLLDDGGRLRPISGTVLLDGLDCGRDGVAGCGRHCPMMYRDEWLEPAAQPAPSCTPAGSVVRQVRIRTPAEIDAGLDILGQRDGLMFMPEMARYSGTVAQVAGSLEQVFEYDRWIPTRKPILILAGLHCSGAILGSHGPCDRACAILWHSDWLEFEA